MSDELELSKAEQQFTGFDHLYKGGDIISLVEAMGLKKEEWEQIKIDMPWLAPRLIEEVDKHFRGTMCATNGFAVPPHEDKPISFEDFKEMVCLSRRL